MKFLHQSYAISGVAKLCQEIAVLGIRLELRPCAGYERLSIDEERNMQPTDHSPEPEQMQTTPQGGPAGEEVLAMVTVSASRRWLALGMLAVLGMLLVIFGFTAPPAQILLQVFVVSLGALSLALSAKMYASTGSHIALTRSGLRDGDGTLIAPVQAIKSVDRGAFAFKPSNGFLLRLDLALLDGAQLPRSWRPGLWWRLGARVGVGGVTPGNQTKIMAELIQALIAERSA
jgi:hypothetical protein